MKFKIIIAIIIIAAVAAGAYLLIDESRKAAQPKTVEAVTEEPTQNGEVENGSTD